MSTSSSDTQVTGRDKLFQTLMTLGRPAWMINVMEMIERLAYYGVRVVIPIYIMQADEPGGLHFTGEEKGVIFAVWAGLEALLPMVSGGFADRYGYKNTIAASIAIKITGYLLMATQRDFWFFLIGCAVLAAGTGIFKPGVNGTMSQVLTKRNSSVGWGAFYMVVNIGGFLGPPLAHFLVGISWPTVFYGCAGIVSLNFLMLLTYKEVPAGGDQTGSFWHTFKMILTKIFNKRLLVFVAIMSGFWLMFMQLFDMLPNFIVDWVDSSGMVKTLGLPDWMLQYNTERGQQISQEWLINANAGLIILLVVFVNWLVSRMRRVHSIFLGITISSIGLMLAGFTTIGWFCLMGILFFSVGEMLSSPKMYEYLGVIAPDGEKGLYMGYANVPRGVGWVVGSLIGGSVYANMGDKANLAIEYLQDNYDIAGVTRPEAMDRLVAVSGMTHQEATNVLWAQYDPWTLWIPFALIGVVSAIAMLFYSRWVRQFEAPDV